MIISRTTKSRFSISKRCLLLIAISQLFLMLQTGCKESGSPTAAPAIEKLSVYPAIVQTRVNSECAFFIAGGTPPYRVQRWLSGKNYITLNENLCSLNLNTVVDDTIIIADASYPEQTIVVPVKAGMMGGTSNRITLTKGEQTNMRISGAMGAIRISKKPDTQIASAGIDADLLTVTGASNGRTSVSLTEENNSAANITIFIEVIEDLTPAVNLIQTEAGTSYTLNISGGTPPYSGHADDAGLCSITSVNNGLKIHGKSRGTTKLRVSDASSPSRSKEINLVVTPASNLLANPNEAFLTAGRWLEIKLSEGIPPYKCSAESNGSLCKIVWTDTSVFRIYGISNGETVLRITDASAPEKFISLPVTILPDKFLTPGNISIITNIGNYSFQGTYTKSGGGTGAGAIQRNYTEYRGMDFYGYCPNQDKTYNFIHVSFHSQYCKLVPGRYGPEQTQIELYLNVAPNDTSNTGQRYLSSNSLTIDLSLINTGKVKGSFSGELKSADTVATNSSKLVISRADFDLPVVLDGDYIYSSPTFSGMHDLMNTKKCRQP